MKKVFLAMTAVCALTAAAPATAQYASANANAGMGISNRITQLQSRIDAGVQAGTIDRSEAFSLRSELRQISRLERQYSRNGLTQQERMDLQTRLRDLRQDVRFADGGNSRWDRYGANDDWNDGYSGTGGPYEDVADQCESRSGIRGVVDSVLGNNCLRVGARASGNLSSVPYEYRSQYRDGNGVYYRSDGRQIYQIDARTNTVLRIYRMDR